MSTELKSKIAYMTKEQFEFVNSTDKNFSKFVRIAIEKEMRGVKS